MEELSEQYIRLSLRWIALGFIGVFIIGIAGGLLGVYINGSPRVPLINERNQLVTTVQEVTISPSQADAAAVEKYGRSVVSLARKNRKVITHEAVGVVITTDGIVVSTENILGESIFAFDAEGKGYQLSKIGTDELYGLTYYRMPDRVVTPFEMAPDDPRVGSRPLGMSRSADTLQIQSVATQITGYTIPDALAAPGIQSYISFVANSKVLVSGTPLLDDEGRAVGVVVNEDGVALPVSVLRSSLDRVTRNKREENPFVAYGVLLSYTFTLDAEKMEYVFTPEVRSVSLGSVAAGAGLKSGDVIKSIEGEEVTWTTDMVEVFSAPKISLNIERSGEMHTIVLSENLATE